MSEWNPPVPPRRPVLSVIGSASPLEPAVENLCLELGRRAIEAGFRLVTGGLTGVMTAVSKGARSAPAWREGDILGVLPSYDRSTANPFVDVSIPTGLQLGRNVIVVAMADVIIAVGGLRHVERAGLGVAARQAHHRAGVCGWLGGAVGE